MAAICRPGASTPGQAPHETFETRAVRLSQVAPVFARMADGMLLSWRRAFGVPDPADPEIESEWATLRVMLDEQFSSEFTRHYAGLLQQRLGATTADVLIALENEDVQAYLAVVERVEADLAAALREYLPRVQAAVTAV